MTAISWPTVPPFGTLPVPPPDVLAHLGLDLPVGRLTALRSRPVGPARGVVLVVPGFTGSKEDFAGFLPLLAEHGWEAWSYSQRGQADSAAPAGLDSYTLDLFAGDVVAVVAMIGAGRPVHLVGHSFGGIVARAAAIAAPAGFVDLTMLCSGPRGWAGRMQREANLVRSRGSAGWWDADNPHAAGLPDAALNAAGAFDRFRTGRTSDDSLIAGAAILADETDSTAPLAETGLPVLVAHGADDPAWPQDWQRAMALALNGRYSVIPDAAHSPQLENPAGTLTVLDEFWAATGPGPVDPVGAG